MLLVNTQCTFFIEFSDTGTPDAHLSQVAPLYPCAFSMQALRREKRKVPRMIVNLMPADQVPRVF